MKDKTTRYERLKIVRICDPLRNSECLNYHLKLHAEQVKNPKVALTWDRRRPVSTKFDGQRIRIEQAKAKAVDEAGGASTSKKGAGSKRKAAPKAVPPKGKGKGKKTK